MSRKNVITPYQLFSENLDASFVSKAVNVQFLDNVGIQIAVTTTANTGLFTVEASIDGVTYDTLKLSPVIPALVNASTTISVNLNQIPYVWIRVRFVLGTGTNGTATAFVAAKEI